jgi:uncharacterized repeat protein (TIGR02543 family)
VYAKWVPLEYTIEYYNVGGGAFTGNQPGAPDRHIFGMATELVVPTMTGFTFAGWFEDSGGGGTALVGNKLDPAKLYTNPLKVYAKWNSVTYNIHYNANGSGDVIGTAPDSHLNVSSGDVITLRPQGDLSRTGYIFNGWNTNAAGTGTTYAPGSNYTVDRTATLYAKWDPREFDIEYYDIGGGVLSGILNLNAPNKHIFGTPTSLGNNPTKTGYTFGGWHEDPSGSGTAVGNSLSATKVYSNPIKLYARWTAQSYIITYRDVTDVAFSGTHGSSHPTTHTYGTETLLVNPSKTGYTFDGWFTVNNGTGLVTSLSPTGYTGSIILYAKWSVNIYTITYRDVTDVAFSGVHGPSHPTTHTYGTATTLVNPTKTNYTFGGWFINSNGGETAQILTSLAATGYTANITLYALWNPINRTVTYSGNNNNGGTMPPAAQTVLIGTVIQLPNAGSLLRSGHTFGGWNENATGTGINYSAGSDYQVNSTVTLYAKWNPIAYNISYFDVGGGTFSGTPGATHPTSHTYGNATQLGVPTKTYYTFGGWYEEDDINGVGTPLADNRLIASKIYTNPIKLYAKWIRIQFTVTLYRNDGTPATPIVRTVNAGEYTPLPGPSELSRTGYTLSAWNTSSDGGGGDYIAGTNFTPTVNTNLHARWVPNEYTITYQDIGGEEFSGYHDIGTPFMHVYGIKTDLVSPTKLNSKFLGWFIDSGGLGTALTELSPTGYTNNIILYAKWSVTYTITFTNSGDGITGDPPPPITVMAGESLIIPGQGGLSGNPGYTFDFWSTYEGTYQYRLYPGTSFAPLRSMTFWSSWTAPATPTRKITFNSATQWNYSVHPTMEVPLYADITIPDQGDLYSGDYRVFYGWYIRGGYNYDGGNAEYNVGATFHVYVNTDFYPNWGVDFQKGKVSLPWDSTDNVQDVVIQLYWTVSNSNSDFSSLQVVGQPVHPDANGNFVVPEIVRSYGNYYLTFSLNGYSTHIAYAYNYYGDHNVYLYEAPPIIIGTKSALKTVEQMLMEFIEQENR